MGAWSASILGNDTSCEVRERFLELYDLGENPKNIALIVLDEQKENLEYDKTNVLFGLALACWECKSLTKELFNDVKNIVETKEDIAFNKGLDADENFLKKRQNVLNDFINKISIEKPNARRRTKIPIQVESIYKAGMCLVYKNRSNNYIGIYITNSEHFKNKGKIEFFFMDFESSSLPTLKMFCDSRLYGLKKLGADWAHHSYEYQGNVTDMHYEKDSKEIFFNTTTRILTQIGQLKEPDRAKLINDYKGNFMYLQNAEKMIDSMEDIRLEGQKEFKLSKMSLADLLEQIALT
jgi:hypothetical protein